MVVIVITSFRKARRLRKQSLFRSFLRVLLRFCYNGKECAAAAGANFSAAAPVGFKIGSYFREGAPPSTKSTRFRQYMPSYFGFPLHSVPFRTPATGFSDTLSA